MRLKLSEKKLYKNITFVFSSFFLISFAWLCLGFVASASTWSEVQGPPYPIGGGFGYFENGQGRVDEDLVSIAISSITSFDPSIELIYVCGYDDYGNVYLNGCRGFSNVYIASSNVSVLSSDTRINYVVSSSDGFIIGPQNNFYATTYQPNSPTFINLGNYASSVSPEGGVTAQPYLMRNVFIPAYPIYIADSVDPSVYDDVFDYFTEDSNISSILGGKGIGKITDSNGNESDVDLDFEFVFDDSNIISKLQDILDSDSLNSDKLDDIITLLSSANGKYDNLITYLQGNTASLGSKLDTIKTSLDLSISKLDQTNNWLERIYNKLVEIASHYGFPTFAELEEQYENTLFDRLLELPQDIGDSVLGSFYASPKTAEEMSDIWYHFQWNTTPLNNNQASFFNVDQWIHFSFDWYESIRDKFLLILFTFIYVTVLFLNLKKIPSIINGVSGVGDSFSDQNKRKEGGSK